ncbi:MAG: hypothetical protein V7K90_18775 [Nostoc sp.]|uniref:hypothetical protein n=1 Tax=Nostoc sp. TaxID=1180 RepID=UPI002FF45BD0
MPRKRQRFGKLHQTLKDTGYAASTGPAGEYLKFLQGTNKLLVPRKPTVGYLKSFSVGVTPFGEEPNTGTSAITALQTNITVQADIIRGFFNAVAADALFGIERDLAKTNIDDRFYSAECQITVVPVASLTGAKSPHTSTITKRAYKSFPGVRSGSIPYGRTTTAPAAETEGGTPTTPTLATVSEEDVRKSLELALKKGTVASSYSIMGLHFIPEEFVEPRSFDKKKVDNAPTTLPTG